MGQISVSDGKCTVLCRAGDHHSSPDGKSILYLARLAEGDHLPPAWRDGNSSELRTAIKLPFAFRQVTPAAPRLFQRSFRSFMRALAVRPISIFEPTLG